MNGITAEASSRAGDSLHGASLAFPAHFARIIESHLERLTQDDIVARIWRGDSTVWPGNPTLIRDRLGWLHLPQWADSRVPMLESFASEVFAEGFRSVLLLGIGGATLGAEVIRDCVPRGPGGLDLHILDSTHPAEVAAAVSELDLPRTLVLVASKSGSTIETMSLLDYFGARCDASRQMVAITNAGSELADLAGTGSFRQFFVDPPGVGGRFSPLSYFGLVPAALRNVDLRAITGSAAAMAHRCEADGAAAANPGAFLGTVLGGAWLAGRQSAHVRLAGDLAPMGVWVEQMLAESTGKEGKGILPIVRGELPVPSFREHTVEIVVESGGHRGRGSLGPLARVAPGGLGGEIFRWQFATAIAGYWLEINPFDEPDVQDSKDRTSALLAGGERPVIVGSLDTALAAIDRSGYVAVNAFLPRDPKTCARLEALREALQAHFNVPVLVAHGPRFLHSTGQLQKGGPANLVAIQVVDDPVDELDIPGRTYGFAALNRARADSDIAALAARGRRVARATLEEVEAAVDGFSQIRSRLIATA